MYDWRATIGIIHPMGGSAEYAFNHYAPPGVAFHCTSLWFPGPTPEGLIYLAGQLEEAAALYRSHRHDVVMFACTAGSCIKGLGFDKECITTIEKACRWPGLTTSTGVLEAFEALGVNRAAVMTPYPDKTNQAEKKFLEDNSLHVTTLFSAQFYGENKYAYPDKRYLYQNARKVDIGGAEVLFISCMGLQTMEIIEVLEADFGIPVLTSQQVSLWACLRHAGIKDKLPGLGKLFTI